MSIKAVKTEKMNFVRLLVVAVLLFVGVQGYSLKVVNKVNPCSGRSYCTLKMFYTGYQQKDLCLGATMTFDGSQIPGTGLGIQENGMYCRSHGGETGCINPDNAGMQLVLKGGSCNNIQLNDPFYCGKYPPNAKSVLDVQMSGSWPNCVATIYRKGGAPGCQSRC
ncbi:FabZ [Acrasis kona]|uniref:FabZ n=1 Tax=Acrasis kona TaxID=1008807 RepID=A0AAW2ZEQ9_9EUKA